MTKVRRLDMSKEAKKELKKIEFVKQIMDDGGWYARAFTPGGWDNIDLICINWNNSGFDLMHCYDDDGEARLTLGHFNDGVV